MCPNRAVELQSRAHFLAFLCEHLYTYVFSNVSEIVDANAPSCSLFYEFG